MLRRVVPTAVVPAAWRAAPFASKLCVSDVFDKAPDAFVRRHIGPKYSEAKAMLAAVDPELKTVDELMDKVVPKNIRRESWPEAEALTETEALSNLRRLMMRNKLRKSFIGQGYYDVILPPAIQRNVLENPGWYTPYTPYQAEISQGRLESLLNYQTAVTELTGMELANASLLDEATAAAEAVSASIGIQAQRRQKNRTKIFVDRRCFAASIEMIRSRIGDTNRAEIVVGDLASECDPADPKLAAIVVQTPDRNGAIRDFSELFAAAAKNGVISCCATELLTCTTLKPPGEMGADFVFGNGQRLGIPLGFGGPHPAFFACKEAHKRFLPGRIIGVSIDSKGRRALRMALQTREQHIKRANATSNICTAQALLANMAAFYCIYHGPTGLKHIATRIHDAARTFALGAEMVGHQVLNKAAFFDTVTVKLAGITSADFLARCEDRRINVWRVSDDTVSLAFDEATTSEHLTALLESAGMDGPKLDVVREMASKAEGLGVPSDLLRTSKFLRQAVFHDYHNETDLMRYIWTLQRKDFGLQHGMVPLGSCTMKLNPAATMLPMSWQRVTAIHPYVPAAQAEGYKLLATELVQRLKEVSGLDAVSLQPNSGAQGEYAGIRTIKAYLNSIGEGHRNLVVIPANAHGTNPATATVCGLKPITVNCEKNGSVDVAHLKQVCEKHGKDIACAMITYPSTYGVFDSEIKTITDIVHQTGGQVYIDGANFNAMLGYTGPGFFGGDVCHFNLHKTFSIPHGGGGPGMGPIACKEHLAPFLPNGPHDHIYTVGGSKAFGPTSQAPLGSASILTISYMLITMLGNDGVKHCSEFAVLAANYLRKALEKDYAIRFVGKSSGMSAHEFIIDMNGFGPLGVKAEDIAKRLMDYGFHAPTLAFPVNNTLMVEPTESEPKRELDRFIAAMLSIRNEIRKIESGEWPKGNNPLNNAPHPAEDIAATEWDRPYSREVAAYPMGPDSATGQLKFWPTISRVNNEHGDMNLFCSCGPAAVNDAESDSA
eukprot:CAMPEP_0174827230 /NCGR_PEP_ID=MMETSP1114-20130205/561_1 /TAXON_ID=312471 /ORGANISM="Neobodo designis, Strain CCAP 1951/1" /LENGTH=1003 /DNA_ID=CAMNT_0016060839 /DNA_START=86 /DNA_END=3097 /DNA_ORIENTATION=-